jgi:hypothetical protein
MKLYLTLEFFWHCQYHSKNDDEEPCKSCLISDDIDKACNSFDIIPLFIVNETVDNKPEFEDFLVENLFIEDNDMSFGGC